MPPNGTTTLASTSAATTLAPAHERREAREVDALLEAQRQRVVDKEAEVRALKRHVHALSKHTPQPHRRPTHAYLDRHKAAKASKGGKGKVVKKGRGDGEKEKQGKVQEEKEREDERANVDNEEKPDDNADDGSSLNSTTQSNSSSIVSMDDDDDNDDDDSADRRQGRQKQRQRQRDRTVDLYDQMAATLDQRIQSSDGGSPAASGSHSPFTLASSAPQTPRRESSAAEMEQLTDALHQLQMLAAKQQQTITVLQQQQQQQSPLQPLRRTTSQQQRQPTSSSPPPPPVTDLLWSKEVESLLHDKYTLLEQHNHQSHGKSEHMREVRRVLKETIGNLEEKLEEVEKWKRAALQAEAERVQAVEEAKRARRAIVQQQAEKASSRSAVTAAQRQPAHDEDDEEKSEQEEEEEEEEEEDEDEDEPVMPAPPPPKRNPPARSPTKSPSKTPAQSPATKAKKDAANDERVTVTEPSSVYAGTAAAARSSAAPVAAAATRSSPAAQATAQPMLSPLALSPALSAVATPIPFSLPTAQPAVFMSAIPSPSNPFHPSPHPSPPLSSIPAAISPALAAHFSPVQPTTAPTAVTVEVLQGTLNSAFFLFTPTAPSPHTFLSCHLPPHPPTFSALSATHSPAYRLAAQLPLPQAGGGGGRLVVGLYAQVGGGESAKVGEGVVDVWAVLSAAGGGGGGGLLQLWWEGDDKDSMTAQERLIATLPYTIRPTTLLPTDEATHHLSYTDHYSTRASASPPVPSPVRASRSSSLVVSAPPPPPVAVAVFTMTVSVLSCSVVRLSRLQLRSQCSIADFNAPLTILTTPPSASSPPAASTTASRSYRLSVDLYRPVAQCMDGLLRLHLSIDAISAPPVGYFDVPLRPLLSEGTGGGGERQQQWSAVHEPNSDLHIGSIEYGLQWSVFAR